MKQGIGWLLAAAGLAAVSAGYSFFAERHWIELRSQIVGLPRLPQAFRGIRLVQFSDVHLGHFYGPEALRQAAVIINAQSPDVLCFTGDLVDRDGETLADAVPVLRELNAPFGKFAVLGNHDYRVGAAPVRRALEEAGFAVLDNRHVALRQGGEALYLAGVEDVLHGQADLAAALSGIPEDGCTVLLAHEPDFADEAARFGVDLQLSGHSHGGQVRVPFVGHVLTPRLGEKYVDGLHLVERSGTQVYTNRGLGTTILPFRLLCRPELTVLTLDR
jgi:predicted MPP superfamily phosphohydrolase